MPSDVELAVKAQGYLHELCREIGIRRVGSPGNRRATAFFAQIASSFGHRLETVAFDCCDWENRGVSLNVAGRPFKANASPYSLGCRVQRNLASAGTLAELEKGEFAGQVLLLYGELSKEQLMPKNFPFYNPDEHKHLIAVLEQKRPAAIVAATTRNPELVGALYPFPLFVDGDFDIPSAYMTEREGRRLRALVGQPCALNIETARIPALGYQITAVAGECQKRRVVCFAHIDAYEDSPGALDNASGTVMLLLLAELLKGCEGGPRVELVAMNGEDHYSAAGEKMWVRDNDGRFDEIVLGINVDDIGFREGHSSFSLYGCPDALAQTVRETFQAFPGLMEGEAWYQGDHGLYIQNAVPAVALTSEPMAGLMRSYTHTKKDVPELIAPPSWLRPHVPSSSCSGG